MSLQLLHMYLIYMSDFAINSMDISNKWHHGNVLPFFINVIIIINLALISGPVDCSWIDLNEGTISSIVYRQRYCRWCIVIWYFQATHNCPSNSFIFLHCIPRHHCWSVTYIWTIPWCNTDRLVWLCNLLSANSRNVIPPYWARDIFSPELCIKLPWKRFTTGETGMCRVH